MSDATPLELARRLNAQGLFVGVMMPAGESSEVEVIVMHGSWVRCVERDTDAESAMRRAYEKVTEASRE